MQALEVISLISLVFWFLLTLDRRRSWPGELRLRRGLADPSADRLSSVVAIVPARNEAAMLPYTLPGLLEQGVDVVLVDDSSDDDTAGTARRLAEEVQRSHQLVVVRAPSSPSDWSGKVHALLYGYVAILEKCVETGHPLPEWLLLTDADIRHRSSSLQSLLEQASRQVEGGPYDLVSVMARLRAKTFWERLVIPAFVFFFQLLYPFRLVRKQRSRVAAAAGGCVLIRRTALEDVGGFAAIGGEIIDDVALGRVLKRRGHRIWLGLDPGIASVRPYEGLADLWRMVSRTAFTQLHYRWDLLIATLVTLGVLLILPPILGGLAVFLAETNGAADSPSLWRSVVWSGLTWALMFFSYLPAVRYHRVPWGFALALPLSGALFGLMTADSAWQDLRGRGAEWKGRHYDSS